MNIKLSKTPPKSRGDYLLTYDSNMTNAEFISIDEDGDGNLIMFSSLYNRGIETLKEFLNNDLANEGALWSEKLNFIVGK